MFLITLNRFGWRSSIMSHPANSNDWISLLFMECFSNTFGVSFQQCYQQQLHELVAYTLRVNISVMLACCSPEKRQWWVRCLSPWCSKWCSRCCLSDRTSRSTNFAFSIVSIRNPLQRASRRRYVGVYSASSDFFKSSNENRTHKEVYSMPMRCYHTRHGTLSDTHNLMLLAPDDEAIFSNITWRIFIARVQFTSRFSDDFVRQLSGRGSQRPVFSTTAAG